MPSPASTSTDREAAARIAAEIADRLTDPERVAAVAAAPDNLMHYPGDPQPVWHPQSLSDGHPRSPSSTPNSTARRPRSTPTSPPPSRPDCACNPRPCSAE